MFSFRRLIWILPLLRWLTAFGVGSEIIAQVCESSAFDYLDAPPERITGADVPTPVSFRIVRENQVFIRVSESDQVPYYCRHCSTPRVLKVWLSPTLL